MLSRDEIKGELYRIMDEIGLIEETEVGTRVHFETMDSIQLISTVVEIEEHFGIEMPDEYLVTEFFEDDKHIVDVIIKLMENSNKEDCAVDRVD